MGIDSGVAESRGHPLDHRVRHRVLQAFGFRVHRIPGIPEKLHQIGLDQPMAPDHAKRRATAFVGQLNTAVGHMLQQTLLR